MTGDTQYTNLPLFSTFLKYFNRSYLGPAVAAADDPPTESDTLPDGMIELVPVEIQKKMRELFISYFETASKTLVKGQIVGAGSTDD